MLSTSITGRTIAQKLVDIRAEMKSKNCDLLVITALDEVAWLLNLRGTDIKFNPVFYAYVVVEKDSLYIFVETGKLNRVHTDHFRSNGAMPILYDYDFLQMFLTKKIPKIIGDGAKVWISSTSSFALTSLMPLSQLILDVCRRLY